MDCGYYLKPSFTIFLSIPHSFLPYTAFVFDSHLCSGRNLKTEKRRNGIFLQVNFFVNIG